MKKTVRQTILIIDDEDHLLIALQDFLTFEGYLVHLARSAEDALESLHNIVPDLIILDISMPGIGGLGFLREVSRKYDGAGCPILILTARSNMGDFFEQMDVAGFLAKPCPQSELLNKIRDVLPLPQKKGGKSSRTAVVRVLLGEDDEYVGGLIKKQMEEAGHVVTLVMSGPEVLEKAPVERPEVVVMKALLARMNGDAVAILLKKMPSTRGVPIVIYDPFHLQRLASGPPRGVAELVRSNSGADILKAVDRVVGANVGETETLV